MKYLHTKEGCSEKGRRKRRCFETGRQKCKNGWLAIALVFCVLLVGSRAYVSATETDSAEDTGTTETVRQEEMSSENSETREEEDTGQAEEETGGAEEDPAKQEETTEHNVEQESGGEGGTEPGHGSGSFTEETLEAEQTGEEYGGLYYYLSKCAYDSKVKYLEQYIRYMEKQQGAYEEMYRQGEATPAEVKDGEAQYQLVRAELAAAENESAYYALCINEKKIDCSDYDVKAAYEVESVEYYKEHYPKKDILTICRYVTDYKNAAAYAQAKETEIAALKEKLAAMELLYREGEISELTLLKEQVSLAKAEYEKTQYQVEMGKAYCNICLICIS